MRKPQVMVVGCWQLTCCGGLTLWAIAMVEIPSTKMAGRDVETEGTIRTCPCLYKLKVVENNNNKQG